MIPSPALVQMVPSPQVANIMTQRNGNGPTQSEHT